MKIRDWEYWQKRTWLSRLFYWLNVWIFYELSWGFCLTCYKFTFDLHDSSDQSYHCWDCCWEKELVDMMRAKK